MEEIKNKDFHYFMKEYGPYILVIIGVLLFKQFLFAPVQVNGDSMYDTLHTNDIMILDKISKRTSKFKRFDIVVISYKNKYLIKRIIGLPGEEVEYKDNKLYINGEFVEEKFLNEETETKDFKLEGKVPDNFYFVMGDNRSVSLDSRSVGCFSIDKLEGRANLTIFPFSRFGNKE